MYDLVCLGASWGGLQALGRILTDLPAEFDLPIAIAQHRHPDSQEGTLPELLQAQTNRPDGALGLARIKKAGGVALIQDPLGAARRTMPDAAIAATVADAILPLEEIGKFIYGLWVNPSAVREAAETR